MKSAHVLLLGVNPSCDLSGPFLESTESSEILRRPFPTWTRDMDPHGYVESAWPELVSRRKPAVSFAIAPWDALKQVGRSSPSIAEVLYDNGNQE